MIAFCRDKRRRDLVLPDARPQRHRLPRSARAAPAAAPSFAVTFLKDPRPALRLRRTTSSSPATPRLRSPSVQPPTSDDPLTVTVDPRVAPATSRPTPSRSSSQPSQNSDRPPGIDPQPAIPSPSPSRPGVPLPSTAERTACCPSNLPRRPTSTTSRATTTASARRCSTAWPCLLPDWTETHVADPGIALVEALAYTADRVSYLQDAVNTEAYLGTARSRISLRRHARLVDYPVQRRRQRPRLGLPHHADATGSLFPPERRSIPSSPASRPSVDPDSYAAALLPASPGPVFESIAEPITLSPSRTRWTSTPGATAVPACPSARPRPPSTGKPPAGAFTTLAAGQVLIFEEMLGPLTGDPADADPTHRWAVRLTSATTTDNSRQSHSSTRSDPTLLLTRITWDAEDALPFPLCLASVTAAGHPGHRCLGRARQRGRCRPGHLDSQRSARNRPTRASGACRRQRMQLLHTAGAAVPRPRFPPEACQPAPHLRRPLRPNASAGPEALRKQLPFP